MPYVIEKAPNGVGVTIDHGLDGPQVSWTEARELLEVCHYFCEISLNLRVVAFLWIPVHSFNHLVSTIQPIYQICENYASSAVVRKICNEALSLFLAHWFQKSNIICEPIQYFILQSVIYSCLLE